MTPPPLLSVIMSVYNAEKYLDESIQSILTQTYKLFEFIIIDDGSKDRSYEIIKNYQHQDSRIILISRENRGLIESLNEGISIAKGKYVLRMDADDIALPSRLQEQFNFMESNPNIGISGTGIIAFGHKMKNRKWLGYHDDQLLKAELLFSSPLMHPTIIMRKDLINTHQLIYDKAYLHAEDFELWTRFAKVTQLSNIAKPLLMYRISKDNITKVAEDNQTQRVSIIKSIFSKYLKDLDLQNSDTEDLLHFNLSVNQRMQKSNISFKNMKKYFEKIIIANRKNTLFDEYSLKIIMGKKWLWNFYYQKKIKALFSKYFYYGILSLIK